MATQLLLLAASLIAGCVASPSTTCTSYSDQSSCPSLPISTLPDCAQLKQHAPQQLFAVIGDYGLDAPGCEANVARLVQQMESDFGTLDFVATVGDNNYWNGDCVSMNTNVDQYYGRFTHAGAPPSCTNPPGARRSLPDAARFFPSLGNHDWDAHHASVGSLPYLQYFNYLPALGNQGLYYNVSRGPLVELFALNSNYQDPTDPKFTTMKAWLQEALAASRATFKLVYFHHPPYTTAQHDPPGSWMRWPFKAWGASLVLSGHQHTYERLVKPDGLTYIVNGLGGHNWLYSTADMSSPQCAVEPGSVLRYNKYHGAMLGAVDHQNQLQFCFYSVEAGGTLVDSFTIGSAPSTTPTAPPAAPPTAPPTEAPPTQLPESSSSEDGTEILLIGAGVMSGLAVLALAGGAYLRWRLQSNPASVFESAPQGWAPVESAEPVGLLEQAGRRMPWSNQNHVDLKPEDFSHASL